MRMNSFASAATIATVAGLGLFSTAALAASQFTTGANPSASAGLEFKVKVPSVLYLQVGTGTLGTTVATTSEIEFEPTAAQLAATGVAVAATTGSGDLGNGAVTVRVFGNNGTVSLTSDSTEALESADGDVIPWSEILVTALNGNIAHPGFTGGVSAPVNLATTSGKVTDRADQWTYRYANSAAVAPGEYTAEVTYTASMP
jgi:hypothetical protein